MVCWTFISSAFFNLNYANSHAAQVSSLLLMSAQLHTTMLQTQRRRAGPTFCILIGWNTLDSKCSDWLGRLPSFLNFCFHTEAPSFYFGYTCINHSPTFFFLLCPFFDLFSYLFEYCYILRHLYCVRLALHYNTCVIHVKSVYLSNSKSPTYSPLQDLQKYCSWECSIITEVEQFCKEWGGKNGL